MLVLIDGDIVAYRASYSTESSTPEDAIDKADELIEEILSATTFDGECFEVFLTGSGNFRYDIEDTYKANRSDKERPVHLGAIRDHLVENWGAVVSSGEEADDLIAIRATELGPNAVIASVDKDFLQVPCKHYNTRTKETKEVTEEEGLKFFYSQILTGDRADNVIGLYRVGPVKAEKILSECHSERDMFETCVEAYDGDIEKVIRNARLLWLRREVGQVWHPPEQDSDSQP